MSRENVEICQRAFEAFDAAWRKGDPGAWFDSEVLAVDAEWIPPPQQAAGMQSVYRGREGFVDFIRTWTEDFEGWSVELERLIDAGDDRVVGLFHHRATGKRSGVPVELQMALVYEVQEGRIVRIWNFIDPAEAFAAVGLTEQPMHPDRGTAPFA
jgi:ketosteroid isomerase-like protein